MLKSCLEEKNKFASCHDVRAAPIQSLLGPSRTASLLTRSSIEPVTCPDNPKQVVEDGDHAAVVDTLQSLRESEPSLLVPVLDALGNLSLPPSLLSDITADALGLLESAEPATLPVLVRPCA